MTTEPRIYVACLASYNAGKLFGKWIDATTDIDAMNAEIQELLANSPEPNVTRQRYTDPEGAMHWVDVNTGGKIPDDWEKVGEPYRSAEEWAIHDHEGLGSDLGEYASLAEVARRVAVIELAEERDIPAAVLLEYASDYMSGDWDADDLESAIDENYDGTAESWEAFTEERLIDTGGLEGVPEHVQSYIDFERMGRDWSMSGDWSAYRDGDTGALYFFRNH